MATSSCVLECPICKLSLTQSNTHGSNQSSSGTPVTDQSQGDSLENSRWSTVCTPCGHLFHRACILEWFRVRRHYDGGTLTRGTCPTCRKSTAYHKLTRVYLPTLQTASTSAESEVPSTSTASSSSSRISVSSAVRRYTQQYLENIPQSDSHRQRHELQTTNYYRIYNDFFNMCYGGGDQEYSIDRNHSRRRDLSQNETPVSDINCEKEDCVALRNVYQILSKEYKSLQRKYELEVDISRMKSVLVTSLQQDVDKLKIEICNEKQGGFGILWGFILTVMLFILVWIMRKTCIFFFR